MIPNRFKGQVVIVTGAESGIGMATASRFSREGAVAIGIGLRSELGDKWAGDLKKEGFAAEFYATDVANSLAVTNLITDIYSHHGRIDVLVNNAGVFLFKALGETTDEEWDHVLGVNLKAILHTSRAVLPVMQKANKGAIINIASVHAYATMEKVAAYAASKGAVISLSRQMAIDYIKDGIRVNSVVVGGVATDMSVKHALALGKSLDDLGFEKSKTKLGRAADPEEIASGITYLASEDASFVVGAPFLIDGGLLADI